MRNSGYALPGVRPQTRLITAVGLIFLPALLSNTASRRNPRASDDFFVATVDQPCGEIDRHAGKADDRIGARAGGVPPQRDTQTRLQLAMPNGLLR